MRRFTMFLLATVLALGSMVGQDANFMVQVYGSDDASTRLADVTVTYVNTADETKSYSQLTYYDMRFGMYQGDSFSIPYGTYDLTIEREGYVTYGEQVDINADGILSYTIEPLPTYNFQVQVYGSDDVSTRLADVTVTYENTAYQSTYSQTTTYDSRTGMYSGDAFNEIPQGTYDLTIEREGYVTYGEQVDINADGILSYTIEPLPTYNFQVQVYGSDDVSTRLADVTVTYENTAYQSTYSQTTTYDSRTGMYSGDAFNEIPQGTYDLTIEREGYVTYEDQVDITKSGVLSYTIDPSGSISCMIKASDLIAPMDALGNATVTLTNTADAEVVFSGVTGSTMMDAGYVDFTDVPFGTYDYEISAEGYITVTGSYTLNASSTVGIEETLDPAIGSISCMIKASDLIAPMDALGNATVTLTNTADAEVVFSGVTGSTMMGCWLCRFYRCTIWNL